MGGLFSGPDIPPTPPPAPGANPPVWANAATSMVLARRTNVRNAQGTDFTSGVRPTSNFTGPAVADLALAQTAQPGGPATGGST